MEYVWFFPFIMLAVCMLMMAMMHGRMGCMTGGSRTHGHER